VGKHGGAQPCQRRRAVAAASVSRASAGVLYLPLLPCRLPGSCRVVGALRRSAGGFGFLRGGLLPATQCEPFAALRRLKHRVRADLAIARSARLAAPASLSLADERRPLAHAGCLRSARGAVKRAETRRAWRGGRTPGNRLHRRRRGLRGGNERWPSSARWRLIVRSHGAGHPGGLARAPACGAGRSRALAAYRAPDTAVRSAVSSLYWRWSGWSRPFVWPRPRRSWPYS
jgi:hypothetical protein